MTTDTQFRRPLTEEQEKARQEIMHAFRKGLDWLLVGAAGTGKTTLTQILVADLLAAGAHIAVTAPTNQAVQIIREMLEGWGHDVATLDYWHPRDQPDYNYRLVVMTTHAFLGLSMDETEKKKRLYKRDGRGGYGCMFHVLIADECSMINQELQGYIDGDLFDNLRILYIGDEAQLPPVHEERAVCFRITERSELKTVIRQAKGNYVLEAATEIRRQQKAGILDYGWAKTKMEDGRGINDLVDDKVEVLRQFREMFTSETFKWNNNAARVIAPTNDLAIALNTVIREMVVGKTESPFIPGERIICRVPVAHRWQPDKHVIHTNEEVIVTAIKRDQPLFSYRDKGPGKPEFAAHLSAWMVTLHSPMTGQKAECYIPVQEGGAEPIREYLASTKRWWDWHNFNRIVPTYTGGTPGLRSVYALTTHTAQGSTFDHIFMCLTAYQRARSYTSQLGVSQLLYTAITRPRYSVTLIGDVVEVKPSVPRRTPTPRGPILQGWEGVV